MNTNAQLLGSEQTPAGILTDLQEQTLRIVPVFVPFGSSVDAEIQETFEDGFLREGEPVPIGVQKGGAVYSVTLIRTPASKALSRGLEGLLYFLHQLPRDERVLEEVVGTGEGNSPGRQDYYRLHYTLTKRRVLQMAGSFDALADVYAGQKNTERLVTALRMVAAEYRSRFADAAPLDLPH